MACGEPRGVGKMSALLSYIVTSAAVGNSKAILQQQINNKEMKTKLTFLLLIATMLLISCNKEPKTYILINQTGMEGTVFVHECNNSNETINIQNATVPTGRSKSFFAKDGTVKVKLYIDDIDKWVQQVFYLDGASTTITIDGNTVVGRQEP